MAYRLLDSTDVVQVFGISLVSDALLCTIESYPSGAILLRTVPRTAFEDDRGAGLLNSLSDSVEAILGEGIATDANGVQLSDSSVLLADAVDFTVTYQPPLPVPGEITAVVTVPVNVLTADTQFGSFLTGGSAAERILEAYNRLKALAGG